jgi:glycopeptide antibiotics resistance protein
MSTSGLAIKQIIDDLRSSLQSKLIAGSGIYINNNIITTSSFISGGSRMNIFQAGFSPENVSMSINPGEIIPFDSIISTTRSKTNAIEPVEEIYTNDCFSYGINTFNINTHKYEINIEGMYQFQFNLFLSGSTEYSCRISIYKENEAGVVIISTSGISLGFSTNRIIYTYCEIGDKIFVKSNHTLTGFSRTSLGLNNFQSQNYFSGRLLT